MDTYLRPAVAAAFLLFALLACELSPRSGTAPDSSPSLEQPTTAELEPQRSQLWHRNANDEVEVTAPRTVGNNDQVWTRQHGKGLLKWPDLWLMLYDDTEFRLKDVTPTYIQLFMARGTALVSARPEMGERVVQMGDFAEIHITGTILMLSFDPENEQAIIRMFDGEATVSTLTGARETVMVQAGEWALITPNLPPRVSNQLEGMHEVARRLGLWDIFHEVELDVQAGIGIQVDGQVQSSGVDIVFVTFEATDTPSPPSTATNTPVPPTATETLASPDDLAEVPTDTPSPTATPTEEPSPVTDTGPTIFRELIYDSSQVYYDQCGASSRLVQFWMNVYDPDGIADISFNYYFEQDGKAVSKTQPMNFKATDEADVFTLFVDVGLEGYAALFPAPGRIVYSISATDLLSNVALMDYGTPILVEVAPC